MAGFRATSFPHAKGWRLESMLELGRWVPTGEVESVKA